MEKAKKYYEPAHSVIALLGGVPFVAQLTNRNQSNVARWRSAKSKGGTNGVIPSRVLPILTAEAKRQDKYQSFQKIVLEVTENVE